MPNSFRVRTSLGEDKVIPVKLDQEFDTLEILSLSIFPNDVYTRNCAEFGVICGRVFANKGLGIQNARVSVFIPIQPEDEDNPIISTLYPYKSFADFNEDGYKYNLLPYVQSYTGHVPVGTFPDRIDALTNPAVVEVYDKYYKFTAKTNDAGDFMIFGVPVGEHEIFMQVDLSDIGEFSLTPQDLIRMGRATESQVNGTTFKFSENYSELPQIITLTKTVQVAPFYGEKDVCDYYIVRADFDLTSEAAIEFKPTAVFMGSLISSNNRKKLKKNCRVPGKQGWLCDLIAGPGQIECVRQTIFTDEDSRPVLQEHKLENDGKLIDSNGTWLVELPMNLDYIYTDENGNRRISPDGSVGVPIRGKYRFKIKWQQTTSLSEENRRAYFLVPNIKEYGWTQSFSDGDDPSLSNLPSPGLVPLNSNTNIQSLGSSSYYYNFESTSNVSSYVILVDGVERPEYQQTIPMPELAGSLVQVSYSLIDPDSGPGSIRFERLTDSQFQLQSSYAFSLNWVDYGTNEMITEAINCEDRFYEFQYNKVYTVSQLIDRYTGGIFPSKTIQIKHITDNNCEGDYYPFPTNDSQYRYDILFIVFSFIISILKFVFIPLTLMMHILAFIWLPIGAVIVFVQGLNTVVAKICNFLGFDDCPEDTGWPEFPENPFKNITLPLFLNTEEGCERCRCNIEVIEENPSDLANAINNSINQILEGNTTEFADFATGTSYIPTTINYPLGNTNSTQENSDPEKGRLTAILAGWNGVWEENYINSSNQWKRLPVFTNTQDVDPLSIAGGITRDVFSLDLTLAERLNLFNTKAKYFDNMSQPTLNSFSSGQWNPVAYNTTSTDGISLTPNNVFTEAAFDRIDRTDANSREELYDWGYGTFPSNFNVRPYVFDAVDTLSPGNTGWNQVKVSWGIDFPENQNSAIDALTYGEYKSHFDNLIVMVVDSGSTLQVGGLYTFQNPNDSTDSNKDTTEGVYSYTTNVTVNYANPNYTSGNNRLSQTYKVRNSPLSITGTTCYPADIEYFQVIHEMPFGDYIYYTNLNTNIGGNVPQYDENGIFNNDLGNIRGDYRFSLPFRFLRTNRGKSQIAWGRPDTRFQLPQDRDSWATINTRGYIDPIYTNANNTHQVFFQITNPDGNQIYCGKCGRETTANSYTLDGWQSYQGKRRLKVVFIQRGVDPNSPKINMRFDLRRYFGCKNPWNQQTCRKAAFADGVDINASGTLINPQSVWLVEGQFRMNIPIQPGGQVSGQEWETRNPKGLQLPYHNQVLNNEPNPSTSWSNIFFPSYVFSYNLPNNNFNGTWKTKMPNYYSALDKYTKFVAPSWISFAFSNIYPDLASNDALDLDVIGAGLTNDGVVRSSLKNGFTKFLVKERARNKYDCFGNTGNNGNYNDNFKIPCSASIGGMDLSYLDDDDDVIFDNASFCPDSAIPQGLCCLDGSGPFELNPDNFGGGDIEFGDISNCLSGAIRYHKLVPNYLVNNVGGYWGKEYVEGGSFFSMRLRVRSAELRRDRNCNSAGEQCMQPFNDISPLGLRQQRTISFSKTSYRAVLGQAYDNDGILFSSGNRGVYVSPVYAAFPENVPPLPGYTENTWYVKPQHEITMSNPSRLVFRTDRLPSSDYLQTDENGNAYILGQNSGFKIYEINDCEVEQIGGGEVALVFPTDSNVSDLMPNSNYNEVANSLVNCRDAVDLNSYGVGVDGVPFIHNEGSSNSQPYSRLDANTGPDYVWFKRGTGCYNLVSKTFASLFNQTIPPIIGPGGQVLEPEKKYNDIRSVVEWTQRLKLTFAQCFDIFSHTFSNNWINGTLYAFSFQNATIFDSNNQPTREYCKNTIYFHNPLNNYYYRSSPWNGSSFIGKAKYDLNNGSIDRHGNSRNLLFPTTVLDMGPKNRFIQEIVFSDDYDGYIADVIPTTSYKDITTLQNLFVLSRLVNTKFIQILFPTGNVDDDTGNESGSDDPSIAAFFGNQRWKSTAANPNGELFFGGLLPAQIDGDYSQLISINSEFGVLEYSPENYGQNSIYFAVEDDLGYPYYGVFFSGNNQQRDYITPRRTLWNPNATLPLSSADTTNIPVRTQVVPFYQWRTNQNLGNPTPNIFAAQNNNFNTISTTYFSSGYQTLDRLNAASQYYDPNGNNSNNYKGYIYNINPATGEFEVDSPPDYRSNYTFGAPFYFYFGLIQGASAMDRFITKYVDTNFVNE